MSFDKWLLRLLPIAILSLTGCVSSPISPESEPAPRTSDSWLTNYVETPEGLESKDIYTFLCEKVVQRPTTLTNTCADFGQSVYEIKWQEWNANGATGTGVYSENQCDPDCATGERIETKVIIRLDRFTTDGTRYFFNFLTISSSNFEENEIYEIWDLSKFYREVPDMRE